jgi:hypothetical protein
MQWGYFTELFYRYGLQIKRRNLSLRLFTERRSVRLGVRTPDFHSGNTGSIPVRTTIKASQEGLLFLFLTFSGVILSI